MVIDSVFTFRNVAFDCSSSSSSSSCRKSYGSSIDRRLISGYIQSTNDRTCWRTETTGMVELTDGPNCLYFVLLSRSDVFTLRSWLIQV